MTRNKERVFDGKIASLRRGKDDVREVASGYECGIVLEDFNDFEVGDMIEAYSQGARQTRSVVKHMPNPHRQEKLGELFAAELSDLLRTRVKDPRVGFASITHVEVSGDYRHAKIYISVMGSEEEQANTMKALKHATGFLRHELAGRIVLRYMPEIVFKLDTSIEEGTRILELIRESEKSMKDAADAEDVESGKKMLLVAEE